MPKFLHRWPTLLRHALREFSIFGVCDLNKKSVRATQPTLPIWLLQEYRTASRLPATQKTQTRCAGPKTTHSTVTPEAKNISKQRRVTPEAKAGRKQSSRRGRERKKPRGSGRRDSWPSLRFWCCLLASLSSLWVYHVTADLLLCAAIGSVSPR